MPTEQQSCRTKAQLLGLSDAGLPIVRGVCIEPTPSGIHNNAMLAERFPDGEWSVVFAVANVAELVPLDSSEDQRAKEILQTSSLLNALLPVSIVNAASLKPQGTTNCLGYWISLSADLAVRSLIPARATFISDGHYTFEEVDGLLRRRQSQGQQLSVLFTLARELRARRFLHGASLEDDPDDNRGLHGASHPAHLILSELMILANTAAALYTRERGLPAIYSNRAPDAIDDELRVWMLANRSTSLDLTKLQCASRFERTAAIYSTMAIGDMGLAAAAYGPYMYPLERWADLHNQRVLLRMPAGADLEKISKQLTDRRRETRSALSQARKQRRIRSAAHAVARDGLLSVSALDFTRALKDRHTEIGSGGVLDVAIVARLAHLTAIDIACIFFSNPSRLRVDAERQAASVVKVVIDHLHRTAAPLGAVFDAALRYGVTVNYERRMLEDRFSVTCRIWRDGMSIASGGHNTTLDGAKRHAALAALSNWFFFVEQSSTRDEAVSSVG